MTAWRRLSTVPTLCPAEGHFTVADFELMGRSQPNLALLSSDGERLHLDSAFWNFVRPEMTLTLARNSAQSEPPSPL